MELSVASSMRTDSSYCCGHAVTAAYGVHIYSKNTVTSVQIHSVEKARSDVVHTNTCIYTYIANEMKTTSGSAVVLCSATTGVS